MTEPDIKAMLHATMQLAFFALTGARRTADAGIQPEQRAKIKRALEEGTGQFVLLVLSDLKTAHMELAVIDKDKATVFEHPLLRFDAPVEVALTTSDQVTVTDRNKMN